VNKTADIEFAIAMVVKPGDEVTLVELDDRLYQSYPALKEVDPRWVGAAVSKMVSDGRLVTDTPDATYTADYKVRRPRG
jgi:hypothetical protein